MKLWKIALFASLLIMAGLLMTACQPPADCPECPAAEDCPAAPACPEAEACPECPAAAEAEAGPVIPFLEEWAASGHNDAEAEAFRHWDEDDPAVVAGACARCHSGQGFVDWVADGSVDAEIPAMENETISCTVCHNTDTLAKTSVDFPQTYETEEGEMMNVTISGLGREAVCMSCHQGRQASSSIDGAIAGALEADMLPEDLDSDAVIEALGFANMHYKPAAATLFGTEVKGGYEWAGMMYSNQYAHIDGYEVCQDCHSPHSLEVKVSECAMCHDSEEPKEYRMLASTKDYDGDGDVEEGMYSEVEDLKVALYAAIQAYANDVSGVGIAYDSHAYPYFFTDTNGDGEAGEDEANFGNKYAAFTPNLLRAAHNFQFASKDPGAYAHNGSYMVELLVDSIAAIGGDVSMYTRSDAGHFDAAAEAWRHWDEDGEVQASCAKCHSADGLGQFAHEGVNTAQELSSGMTCYTCHDHEAGWPARYVFTDVEMPSGKVVSFGEEATDANLCINCHQGRSSKATVDGMIASERYAFSNIHYYPAGATLFGTDAQGWYEFDGKEYAGQFVHTAGFATCIECHDTHNLEPKVEACAGCHGGDDLDAYRMATAGDFDGDGDADEGLAGEIETMADALYAAMQSAAGDIVYDSHAYPYFFTDLNGDGVPTPDEANFGNRYANWTPELMRVAFNFQAAQKDPGAYAHNGKYVIQVLYDSLESLGAAGGMTRP